MTYLINTALGNFNVDIHTNEVASFGTEYHSTIRKDDRIVAKVMDLRQVGKGFVPSPYHNKIIGLSEMQAITLHMQAITFLKELAELDAYVLSLEETMELR
tara:strand:+ start:290 stop:592 length:303 start_codon:yes stop_codon:yes gene_type:complete